MSASMKRRNVGALAKLPKEKAAKPIKEEEHVGDQEPWTPGAYTAFKILLSARLCAAAWNVVGDCDETYNYWEPTYYLLFGKGFQTWEYSPVYAIRSYAYLLIHTVPLRIYSFFFGPNTVMLYFFLKCVLAFCCALCETYFYKGVSRHFGGNVARIMLCFQLLSAGIFTACTAYLPSSFCMYMTYMALGAWFLGKHQYVVAAIAASAIVGWPFAGALGIPMAYDIIVRRGRLKLFIMWSAVSFVAFIVPLVHADMHYYGKLVIAPLNIVIYNVFTDHGPDLYGVEPFSFYFINGFLNFNIAYLMALTSLPIVFIVMWLTKSKTSGIPIWVTMAPMYIWIAIFFTRPHKEERFLFPIYPFFVLGGAIAVDHIQQLWSWLLQRPVEHYTCNSTWIAWSAGVIFSLLSLSRLVAVYQAYHAPVDIFVELNKIAVDSKIHTLPPDKPVNVCVGKEWYRFPSSFFLPGQNWQLQFLKSEFKGQLPKPYSTLPDATRVIPTEMNDINKEEPSRYIDISKCHYLIDFDVEMETALEPRYSQLTEEWKILTSVKFLDASRSHRFFRAFYIPFLSEKHCVYADYNLLKTTRTKKSVNKSKADR